MNYNFGFLIFVFVLKIIMTIVIPIVLLFLYKGKNSKKYMLIECIILCLLIVLRIIDFPLITNSNIYRLKEIYREGLYKEETRDIINLDTDYDVYITDKFYKTKNGIEVYYFNNNTYPLSNKKIYCSGETRYLKNYGNGITALSMILSTAFDRNIDPIELLDLSIKNNILDCNSGIDLENLMNVIDSKYDMHHYLINSSDMANRLKNGDIVLARIKYNPNSEKNLFCDTGYIVIYNVDNENSYYILNPNSNGNDIICSDNKVGSFSIIKEKDNSTSWTMSELDSIVDRYYYLERN